MPWARMSYERTIDAYRDLLGEIIPNRRKTIDLIAREQLVRGSLLKYDFTKRQLTILMFLMTYSFNLGKEWAYIPMLKDFSVGGISYKKVRGEIDKMIRMGVIEWNKKESIFRIREPQFWKSPENPGYNDSRSRELFLINLQHGGVDVTPIVQKLKEMDK